MLSSVFPSPPETAAGGVIHLAIMSNVSRFTILAVILAKFSKSKLRIAAKFTGDGIAYRPHQRVSICFTFDQIVLSASPNGGDRKSIVIETSHNHDRLGWCRSLDTRKTNGTLRTVWQSEVEQDNVVLVFGQAIQAAFESLFPVNGK